MNKPELLYGERSSPDFARPESVLDYAATKALALDNVEIFYSLFEIPMSDVLRALPASLHPSIPAVLCTNFWKATESPFGPFAFAYVGPACRTGIKPRHMVTRAWCDNPVAAHYLLTHYGFDCKPAVIRCGESYERIRGQVLVDGKTLLDITTTDCVPIVGGGSVKYSPPLNLCLVDDRPLFAQLEVGYSFKRVLRGSLAAPVFDAKATGDIALTPSYAIAGTFAVCDVQLMPVRFAVDLTVSAEEGGAIKLKR
ncbi:MAG: hypothetical protein O3C28_09385 [Proteobacteria bacterium]|nr:hypothetical protein [Pseudomonadota bacterium]